MVFSARLPTWSSTEKLPNWIKAGVQKLFGSLTIKLSFIEYGIVRRMRVCSSGIPSTRK